MRPLRAPPEAEARRSARVAPGPSRTAYRLARAWARPAVRSLVQVYLPLAAVAVLGWAVVSNDRLRLAIHQGAAQLMAQLAARPELAVRTVEIYGAPPDVVSDIARAVGPVEGVSVLSLDVAGLRARIEEIGAVASATVQIDPAGLLTVEVTRRTPVALWRDGEGALHLIDADGVAIRSVSTRIIYPELPMLLGDGAPAAVAEGLGLLDAAAGLRGRVRALVRVGARRWDLALSGGGVVMLPERQPAVALAGAMALHYAVELFDRDLAAVDLRLPGRPTLRPRPPADAQDLIGRAIASGPGEDT